MPGVPVAGQLDTTGEIAAIVCGGGRLVVLSLFADTPPLISVSYGRPLLAVALAPDFSASSSRRVAVGGKAGQLLLRHRGFFRDSDRLLHSGEGAIYAIAWAGNLIAWANEVGVKVYDTVAGARITYIDRPRSSPRADLYRPVLRWQGTDTLYIGWADNIKVAAVKTAHGSMPLSTEAGPSVFIEIVAVFQTDFWVCGLAPLASSSDELVVLAYVDDDEDDEGGGGRRDALKPELRIISCATNEELSSDALTIHRYSENTALDYRLSALVTDDEDTLFFIVSPHDIVVARPRSLDDRVAWLIDQGEFERALLLADDALMVDHRTVDIGEQYVEHLLSVRGDGQGAATMAAAVLGNDGARWEKWAFRFAQAGHLGDIAFSLPTENPRLPDVVYELVLNHFLQSSPASFLQLVERWPSDIYGLDAIIAAARERARLAEARGDDPSDGESDASLLFDALAVLYTHARAYDKTLEIYLRRNRGDVFGLVQQYDLFDAVRRRVRLLLEFDERRAIDLLVSNVSRVPIKDVVDQLVDTDDLHLHRYLHSLFRHDVHIGAAYHDLQVSLYARFEPDLLLPFLRQSTNYRLESALDVARKHKLTKAHVFILGRMGNNREALRLIMEELRDVKEAIDFVTGVGGNDAELWDDLMDAAMKDPRSVAGLLEHARGAALVDPIRLVRRVPEGMEIEGLRNRLVRIIADYRLQTELREGCNNVLKRDCVTLLDKLRRGASSGIAVMDPERPLSHRCAACHAEDLPGSDIVVYFCGHVYHARCNEDGQGTCAICTVRKRTAKR